MIYLVSKIIVSLLAALGIGFGMAWMLQMHLAARLREQLNSVIFETKSRIPALESEITSRDQAIDGLREELAQKSKPADSKKVQQGSKEQEKQIDELRQKVIDLENELRMARSLGIDKEEAVFEIDEADRPSVDETELMSDDEFLADIQDIFEDTDDSKEAFDSSSAKTEKTADEKAKPPGASSKQSIEEELQNELDGWDEPKPEAAPEDNSATPKGIASISDPAAGPRPLQQKDAKKKAPKPPLRSGSVDLKAELLDLEDEIRSGANETDATHAAQGSGDVDKLRSEIEDLTQARKSLNEIVDTQAKEMASMQQQRDLQDKSLNVLNQQLELARMANERILRELREVKDGQTDADDKPRSATGS